MTPNTSIRKVDGGTGVVRPASVGVLAMIACAASGDFNSAGSFARREVILTEHGHGHLLELSSYTMAQSHKPVVVVRGDPSTAGAYGEFTVTGGGTSDITAGTSEPVDEFEVLVEFVVAGDIGVAGIKYRY